MSRTPPKSPASFADKLFVLILESPSHGDFYKGRQEGQGLAQILKLTGYRPVHRLVTDKAHFRRALDCDRVARQIRNLGRAPILHVSAHGNDKGVMLTSGEVVGWRELRDLLLPLNRLLNGALVVSMSTCKGWNACRTAMTRGEAPYRFMVASKEDVSWDEAAIAYAVFYHQIAHGTRIDRIVKNMRTASLHRYFEFADGDQIRRLTAVVLDVVTDVCRDLHETAALNALADDRLLLGREGARGA